MDEPLSNLDAMLRIQTRAELEKIHLRLGKTTIYVTHDQVEAMTMGDRIVVMKDGVLQQIGTPRELHDHPVNLFVAGFIGSPAMNFFPARIASREGRVFADTGFAKVPLDAGPEHIDGREVILGVRPEDIRDHSRDLNDGHVPVEAKVEVVEYLGNEVQLHLATAGRSFIARMSAETQTQPGETVRLGFNLRRTHLFDGVTQQAISTGTRRPN
jgi:multiple sugar transport system ATP-binding protein